MSFKKGTEMKLLSAAAPLADTEDATIQAATWTEHVNVQSVEGDSSRSDSPLTIRKEGGTEIDLGGKRTDQFSFQVAYNTADAFYNQLSDAYDADDDIALADLDGPIDTPGSKGAVGNFKIKQFRKTEPEEGAVVVNVTIKPTEVFKGNWTWSVSMS